MAGWCWCWHAKCLSICPSRIFSEKFKWGLFWQDLGYLSIQMSCGQAGMWWACHRSGGLMALLWWQMIQSLVTTLILMNSQINTNNQWGYNQCCSVAFFKVKVYGQTYIKLWGSKKFAIIRKLSVILTIMLGRLNSGHCNLQSSSIKSHVSR